MSVSNPKSNANPKITDGENHSLNPTAESIESAVQSFTGNPRTSSLEEAIAVPVIKQGNQGKEMTSGPAMSAGGQLINDPGAEDIDTKYHGPATIVSTGQQVPATDVNKLVEPITEPSKTI
jgi:hypothetical protein